MSDGARLLRDPRKLCGEPFVIDPNREDPGEPDIVYCGLPLAHSGFHVAMVWFWDDKRTEEPER